MKPITNYVTLEELARVRLSYSFFMRDFLYSEIAAWQGMKNIPDHADSAIAVGRRLCDELLEPLQATFGRLHVRSAYRSPEVNAFGNENRLNCANNQSNFASHIWDYPDENGHRGATACIVIPWLMDHVERGGKWEDMAWWIHDHLPYSRLTFFPRLCAFNIQWHEHAVRRIDSFAQPKGCLTRPGMSNHAGRHGEHYVGFPRLAAAPEKLNERQTQSLGRPPAPAPAPTSKPASSLGSPSLHEPSQARTTPVSTQPPAEKPAPPRVAALAAEAMASKIYYRAVHSRTAWRKAFNHRSLEAGVFGKDGAAALFARRVRIDYDRHGDPLFVVIWQDGETTAQVAVPDSKSTSGVRLVRIPIDRALAFEQQGYASPEELRALTA